MPGRRRSQRRRVGTLRNPVHGLWRLVVPLTYFGRIRCSGGHAGMSCSSAAESRAASRTDLARRSVRSAGVCSLNSFLADWKLTLALVCAAIAAIAMIATPSYAPPWIPKRRDGGCAAASHGARNRTAISAARVGRCRPRSRPGLAMRPI